MNYNQFKNLSCYEEFEIQCALAGISKANILKEIGHQICDYYFFVSDDGIFNWFDLNGNHIDDPGVLKELNEKCIPTTITKCIIPNSVTSINFCAFSYCRSLNEITIPNSVTYIGDYVFHWCDSLTKITIPDSVTRIGYGAFSDCKLLTSITIPNSVKSISNKAFYNCESLTSIIIPDSVTSIGDWAFRFCDSLKEVIFKGKTLDEITQMKNYPFGIKYENVFNLVDF